MIGECQQNAATCMHRHPAIFEIARELLGAGKKKVLSFGCSSGEEVRTLKEIGGSAWTVDGLDLKPRLIEIARKADPKGVYATTFVELKPLSYDAVFCMSVLCRFPDDSDTFTFKDFQDAATGVDNFVKPGGLLIIYNAQYDFRQTVQFKRYYKVETSNMHGGSGFVPKFDTSGKLIPTQEARDVPTYFRKGLMIKEI